MIDEKKEVYDDGYAAGGKELNDCCPAGLDDGCATGWERGGLKGGREMDDGC